MKDKLTDLKYSFEDNKDRIMPVFKILMSLLCIFLLLGLFLGWFEEKPVNPDSSGVYTEDDYEILSFSNVSSNEKYYLPSINILITNPIKASNDVKGLVDYVKAKFEAEANNLDKEVSGFYFNIYQRKVQFALDLEPVGQYTYLVEDNITSTIDIKKIPKKDIYVEKFNYKPLDEVKDIEIYDADKILIETIDLPPYITNEDYMKLLKINEYQTILGERFKAIGFYVYYDLNIKDIKGDKYKDKVKEIQSMYSEAEKRNEYLPKISKESLILDYRENHIDVWSNIVVYRGY